MASFTDAAPLESRDMMNLNNAQRLKALEAVSSVILRHSQPQVLVQELAQVLKTILRVDNVAILLPTEDEQHLIMYSALGPEATVADHVLIPMGQGIVGRIMMTGATLAIDDLAPSDAVNLMLVEQLRSVLGMPLRVEGKITGVLHVSTVEQRHFTPDDVQLLELVADRIAIALERTKTFTAIQQAKAQSEQRAAQLEVIFNSMVDGVIVYDREGHVQRLNRAAQRIFTPEIASQSLATRAARHVLTTEDGTPMAPKDWPLTRILAGETIPQQAPCEMIVHFSEDVHIELSCTGAPLRDKQGNIEGAVIIWRDITERHARERQTQQSLHALIHIAQLLIVNDNEEITLSGFQHIVALIQHMTKAHCVSITAIDEQTEELHLLVTHGMPPAAESYWRETRDGVTLEAHFGAASASQLRAAQPIILDMRTPPYCERPNPYEATQFLVLPLVGSGRLYGLLALAANATQPDFAPPDIELGSAISHLLSFVMERAYLVQVSQQIEASLRETEDEKHHLQEANRLKSEFLANMSHELRTPLNGIIGFTELLMDEHFGVTEPEHRDFLGDILTSARHLLHLINDILDLAKIEAGKVTFFPEKVHMAIILNDVQTTVQPLINQKHLQFHAFLDPSITEIYLDVVKLKQIFLNLLSNAIKFTPDGGSVLLRVTPHGPHAFMAEVEDTGIGIRPQDIERLFTAFHQLNEGMTKTQQGTGLGLTLTKQLVEAQGGQIAVHSVPGQGSTFTVTLPRQMVHQEASSMQPQPEIAQATSKADVLVIDDNLEDVQYLTRHLRNAGYLVTSVGTGHEAIAACRLHSFAVLVLDMILPDMHGQEVLQTIREIEGYATVPVIGVTMIPDKSLGIGCEIQDILIKPTKPEQLLQALQQSGAIPQRATILVIDDNPTVRKLLEVSLQREGFRANCCKDGADGLEALKTMNPDVIVLDLLMPKVNGWEFLTLLRANPEKRDIPVIIWTSADLSQADHLRLSQDAQAVAVKGSGEANDVLQLIQQCLAG